MHISLFAIAKRYREPKCSPVGEWLSKLWCTRPVHVYPAVKRNELALGTATGIDLKHTGEWRKKASQQIICRGRLKWKNNTQNALHVRVHIYMCTCVCSVCKACELSFSSFEARASGIVKGFIPSPRSRTLVSWLM